MNIEPEVIPNSRELRDVLLDLEKHQRNSWIFLHRKTLVERLLHCADLVDPSKTSIRLIWEATTDYPEIVIEIDSKLKFDWIAVFKIKATGYDVIKVWNPEEFFFFKGEE